MKTLEERAMHLAQEFGATKANKESAIYRACIRMATEQMELDTEEMRNLNKEWKENLEIQRKMLIDKAREWIINHNGDEVAAEAFVKYMEEE